MFNFKLLTLEEKKLVLGKRSNAASKKTLSLIYGTIKSAWGKKSEKKEKGHLLFS